MIANLPILCFSGQYVSELHMYLFFFFLICASTCSTCSFVVFALATAAHGIIVLLKKSISYFMNIMYKHIFLKFGVISFINKEMVSLFQLHTFKKVWPSVDSCAAHVVELRWISLNIVFDFKIQAIVVVFCT